MLYRYTPQVKGTVTLLLGDRRKLSSTTGLNEIDDDFWVAIKDLPEVKAKIDAGIILPVGNQAKGADKMNLNKVSKDKLIELPGVGQATADRIVSGRPYKTLDAAKQASDLSESAWATVEPLVTI